MKKLFSIVLCLILLAFLPLSVSAENDQFSAVILIDDRADLLSDSQRTMLEHTSVVSDFPFTVVISTVDSIGTSTPEQFANDRYDRLSSTDNGILLLVALESRDWYILTVGKVHDRISNSDCDAMADRFLSDLSDGWYYSAFDTFLSAIPAELDNSYNLTMPIIAIVIGIAVGGIVILIMRSQMKTAKPQRSATGYVKSGSYKLNQHLDFYLYSRVTKTPRPKNTSSGGGGSGSRGGSGGKF